MITLAIIGVVAALTIPTVVKNYQKQVLKTQLKKQWSVMTQLMNEINVLDFGGKMNCYYVEISFGLYPTGHTSDCNKFYEIFAQKMRLNKKCQSSCYSKGYQPKYSKYSTNTASAYGFTEAGMQNTLRTYVLADGTIIMPYTTLGDLPIFAIDINGKSGPNKPGWDLFTFTLINNGKNYHFRDIISSYFSKEEGGIPGEKTYTSNYSYLEKW